jgi:hypothetical protein
MCVVLVALLSLAWSSSARAGTWTVSYQATGSNEGDNDLEPGGTWPTNPVASGGWVSFGIGGYNYAKSEGTIKAVLSWTPSFIGDTPPPKVTVCEEGIATAHTFGTYFEGGFIGTASNGLSDPQVHDPVEWWGVDEYMTSKGVGADSARVVNTNGATSVDLPVRALNAYAAVALGGPVDAGVMYRVKVYNPYVSSTNAKYYFRYPNYAPQSGDLTVKLNGTTVYTGNSPSSMVGVRFDSTHFADDTVLDFSITSTVYGKTYTDHDRLIVYNKHMAMACPDFENVYAIVNSVNGTLGSMNHTLQGSTSYSKSSFLAEVCESTAVHFSLHGWPNGVHSTNSVPQPELLATEIYAATGKKSWRPAINIVFGSACSTSANGATMPAAFRTPGTNGAYVGFDNLGLILGLQKAGDAFWKTLKQGKIVNGTANPLLNTVAYARSAAQDAYDANSGGYATNCLVQGDGSATLYGLYQRTSATQWLAAINGGS